MEKIIEKRFFALLSASNNEFQENELAENYKQFAEELMRFCKNEENTFEVLQALNYIYVEFWFLQEQKLHIEQNVLVTLYLKKYLFLIKLMIKNCKMKALYLMDNKKINTLKDVVCDLDWDISENYIIELATSLQRAKIAYKNGSEATFIDIEQHLERFFNRSPIKRPYNKKSKLPDRVTITPFLDKLKDSFMEDYNSRLMGSKRL